MRVPSGPACVCLSLPNGCSFQVSIHAETTSSLRTSRSFILAVGWQCDVVCYSAGGKKFTKPTPQKNLILKFATEISRFLHRFHLFSAKVSGDQLRVIGPTDSFIELNQSWWEENNCVQSASSHLLISSSFPPQKARSYYPAETLAPAAATQRCDLLAQRRKKGP